MPHAGLMDADALGPEEAALQQAKLHIRAGKRRLRQGKIAAGVVTLYDALFNAMQWYIFAPERRGPLSIDSGDDLDNEVTVYAILTRSGVLDGRFDYAVFAALVEEALHKELPGYDYSGMLEGLESVFTQLGVMPFDEGRLPPEDPSTY
ncbi:MAG: hypothetical protein K8I29_11925 [Alphaproteobacteria bacterium]|uniref:Uncharacterized protein n=1 Tax=Candidatus Nitrobium versatile TaxID=2884831 RepID=A0A953LXE8_9BACT|nr:hypothetical protein [Candidatus Nitrobium versatile]